MAAAQEPPIWKAERAVLGSVIIEQREALPRVAQILAPPHFLATPHAEIYRAMLALDERGEPIDYVTLSAQLGPKLQSCGGVGYLTRLASEVPTAAHAERYALEVRKAWKIRDRIAYLTRALAAAKEPEYDPDEAVGAIIQHLTDDTDANEVRLMSDVALEILQHIDDEKHQIQTGTRTLDRLLGWMDEDTAIQVAAQEGIGKTAWGMQLLAQEVRHGGYALMFSAEMSRRSMGKRLLRHLSGAAMHKRARDWSDEEHIAFAQGMDQAYQIGTSWWIDDTPNIPIDLLVARARMVDRRARALQEERKEPARGLSIILVDYLQTLSPSRDEQPETLEQQVTQAGAKLTALAHTLNTRVVVITSLSNQGNTRYSGGVNYQMDARIILSRSEGSDLVKVDIPKARDGERTTTMLRFDGPRLAYYDLDDVEIPADMPSRSSGRRRAEEREH